MTLQELLQNIRQPHTLEAETHVPDFLFDIKKWIKPCLKHIKNHIYPHAYKLVKINGKVVLKYKQVMMANGFPSSPGYQKTLGNQCYRRLCKKCRRLNSDQRKWWAQFIENERRYRNKWSAVTEEYLCEAKRNRWYLDQG